MLLSHTQKKSRHLISLTPLIDVVFILLLFFMLTTQFQSYQATTVTVGEASGDVSPPPEISILWLQPGGHIKLNDGREMTLDSEEFETVVRNLEASGHDIVMRATAAVSIQELLILIDRMQSLGLDEQEYRLDVL